MNKKKAHLCKCLIFFLLPSKRRHRYVISFKESEKNKKENCQK